MKTLEEAAVNPTITAQLVDSFFQSLVQEEKSIATISKYRHDIEKFAAYVSSGPISKGLVIGYKQHLQEEGYAIRSVNSMLASVNRLLEFMGHSDCRVKSMKLQRQTYLAEEKELTKEEYMRLLKAAENQPRLRLILETICSTGIRVSELRFFTVEMVRKGEVTVSCKGKTRPILIPRKLKKFCWLMHSRIISAAGFYFAPEAASQSIAAVCGRP
jgi:integrase/recombinase XerD